MSVHAVPQGATARGARCARGREAAVGCGRTLWRMERRPCAVWEWATSGRLFSCYNLPLTFCGSAATDSNG